MQGRNHHSGWKAFTALSSFGLGLVLGAASLLGGEDRGRGAIDDPGWRQWGGVTRDFRHPVVGKGSLELKGSDGERLWKRELWGDLGCTKLERGDAARALVYGDLVIDPVGGPRQAVAAFKMKSGELAWSRHDGAIGYASPILIRAAGRVMVAAPLEPGIKGENWGESTARGPGIT